MNVYFVLANTDSKHCGVIRFSSEKRRHQHTPVEGIVMHVSSSVPAMRLMMLMKKKTDTAQLSPQHELSPCVFTSPWSRLFSHRGHMRGGKKEWHHFLRFSTSVPHVTSIQTDLLSFSPHAVAIINRPFSLHCSLKQDTGPQAKPVYNLGPPDYTGHRTDSASFAECLPKQQHLVWDQRRTTEKAKALRRGVCLP